MIRVMRRIDRLIREAVLGEEALVDDFTELREFGRQFLLRNEGIRADQLEQLLFFRLFCHGVKGGSRDQTFVDDLKHMFRGRQRSNFLSDVY